MSKELLASHINALKNQRDWLEHSKEACAGIGIKENYTRVEFDKFETLTSRFARTIDFLIRKVFRSIDDALVDLFEDVLDNSEEIIEICDNTIKYCAKYLN